MLIQKSDELYLLMQDELEAAGVAVRCGTMELISKIPVVRKYLGLLRELAESHSFETPEQEIQFFKSVKPKFYQWLIYYIGLYTVQTSRPMESGKALLNHYTDQLKYYRGALRQYEFYYQYYRMAGVELDAQYFIRNAEIPPVMVPEVPEVDRVFGTAMDYLFSKFMAYENLQEYLLREIAALSGRSATSVSEVEDGIELNWTGETINLLEVAYGMHYTGQINDGKASIIDIVRKMERVFKVSLGRPYRRLSEIRQRKRVSRTKYIDEMGQAINRKMDDDDAYDPSSK